MIEEIYLIHHSHTDIGYTDLPSTAWELHVEYIRQAMAAAEETADYPEETRFHWTCEALLMVDAFLHQATPEERARFAALVEAGQFEVAAMPFNITPLLVPEEWQALRTRLSPLWQTYHARTAFQNDINGFPWGLLPSLKAAGIPYIWMGMNAYSGGTPLPRPAAFWWEGPTKERVLAWIGYGYADGHSWFHEQEWRRGPVPHIHDVWFHPPTSRDIFDPSPEHLARAAEQVQRRLSSTLRSDYPFPILPLQVTNMWRIDNDPPCRHLSDFVRAWNHANLAPRLRLATPGQFLARLEREWSADLPTLRGDWADWWIDGSASTPVELALNSHTKTLLADLPGAAHVLDSQQHLDVQKLSATWQRVSLMDEHTWGAYESVAYPYKPRTLGSWGQKMDLAYRGNEDARLLQAQIIRQSKYYKPTAHTRQMNVLNPGSQLRSGWAELSAQALREDVNAVEDLLSHEIFPLETVSGLEWSAAEEHLERPFEVPNDTWAPVTVQKRFYVRNMAAGTQRHFMLLNSDLAPALLASAQMINAQFAWTWDSNTGHLLSWRDQRSGIELLDAQAPYALGDVVFEIPQREQSRVTMGRHDCTPAHLPLTREVPELTSWNTLPSHYSARYQRTWTHPHCHRIEQQWDFINDLPRLELTTTFWLKEIATPQAIFLAFPWGLANSQARYFSLGYTTCVGVDQLPDGCGEYLATNEGIEFLNEHLCLALNTLDTPIGTFERLHTRDGQRSFTPKNAHFYAYVTQNYWSTNFSITKAGKLIVRHVIQVGAPDSNLLAATNTSLWSFPAR